MASQAELDGVYMRTAILHSKLSKCIRAKVGACLVTKNAVTLTGFNGTPSGRPNACEFITEDGEYVTKSETLHAELNCILKAAKEGIAIEGSTIYVTQSPCAACAAMLVQLKIKRVVYLTEFRDTTGLFYLKDSGVVVDKFKGEI